MFLLPPLLGLLVRLLLLDDGLELLNREVFSCRSHRGSCESSEKENSGPTRRDVSAISEVRGLEAELR